MTDAFISYSRKDQTFVRQIADALIAHGRDVWVDWEDIPLTADWWQQIQQGIESADALIFVVSARSLASVVCHLELAHALQHNKRLIPIIVEMPDERLIREQLAALTPEGTLLQMLGSRSWDELVKANWQQISRHNWLIFDDATAFEANAEKLIEALDTDPSHVNQHTRLLVRALEWDKRSRDNSFLLNGSEISEAESWLTQSLEKEPLPTQLHAEYISASRTAANQRQRRLFAGTAVALVATIGLAILAALFGIDAREQSRIAQENEQTAIANQLRADDNAATATIAQGQARIEADNAATQAAIAEDNASTAVAERDRADEQARLALSRQLAAQSDALLEDSLEIALLLAVEAQRTANTYEAQDSLLRVLEARTQISQYLSGHQGIIRALAISPDGRYIASGGDDSMIRIWEADTGRGYGLPLEDLGLVTALYFTDNGHLLSASTTETLTEWDIATGKAISYPRTGLLTDSFSLSEGIGEQTAAFTADGRSLLTVNTNNQIQLLNTSSGEAVLEVQASEGSIFSVMSDLTQIIDFLAVHPQGEYAAALSGRGIKLFQLKDGASQLVFEEQDLISANGIFSPDGRYFVWYRDQSIVSESSEGTTPGSLEVFDLATETTLKSISLKNMDFGYVTALVFDDDSQILYIGSHVGQLMGFDVKTGDIVLPSIAIFTTDVHSVAYDRRRNRLMAGGRDGRIALINLDAQSQLSRPVRTDPFNGTLIEIAFRESDALFAVSSTEGEVYIVDYETGTQRLSPFQPYEGESISDIAFHPTEDLLATVSPETQFVRLWDFSSGKFELILEEEHLDSGQLMFSPDGRWLMSHGFSDEVVVWDMQTRAFAYAADTVVREDAFSFPLGGNISAAFHPAGDYLLTVGVGLDELHAWRVNEEGFTLLPEVTYQVPEELSGDLVWTLVFSPDGSRLAAGLLDGFVLLWDTATGDLATDAIRVSEDSIQSLSFEPDGRTLAVLPFGDSAVYLFDAETGRRFGAPLHSAYGGEMRDISFTSDGQELIGLQDKQLYAWPFDVTSWARTACRRVNTVWSPAIWARVVGEVPYRITCPEVALAQADELALQGDTEQASALFQQLVAAEDIRDNAELQTAICRVGALGNLAEIVLPACDRAVALKPDDTMALQSRAVAYALLGNYQQAAADLRQSVLLDQTVEPQATTWLLTLDAGSNPFDAAVRRQLRNKFADETTYLLTSVADLEITADYILMRPDEVRAALDGLSLPFYPLTFSGDASPLLGWSITRTDEVDYEALGILRNSIVPGARGFRYVLSNDRDTEIFIGIVQSDGAYATLDDWVDDLELFAGYGETETIEINGVEVFHHANQGSHFYFFIDKGVHTVVVYSSEIRTYDEEITAVITDLTR